MRCILYVSTPGQRAHKLKTAKVFKHGNSQAVRLPKEFRFQTDEVVVKHGVKVLGYSNTPAKLPADASALFARNLYNFLSAFWDKEQGRPVLDEEIGNAVRLTRQGKVVNERLLG